MIRVAETSPERRAGVLTAAAHFQVFIRRNAEAARLLAIEVLEIEGPPTNLVVFSTGTLIHCESQLGHLDDAVRLAAENVGSLDARGADDDGRGTAHCSYAAVALVVGDRATARSQADIALRIARQAGNPSMLAAALWIAGLTREADEPEAALRALEEHVELVRTGASDVNFGGALARLARLRDRDGDLAGALDALHEAVTYFQRVGPRTELVVVVAQFARTLAGHGEAERAAVVAGIVAAGPLMAMGATGTPQRMERATVTARAQIGDTAYESAFARGAAMTYNDAITYIRSQLDLAIAETEN